MRSLLKQLGLHYTEEGCIVIDQILSQMNSNRLSTNRSSKASPKDRASPPIGADEMLKSSSNLEYLDDGRIIIKYLGGRLLNKATSIGVIVQDVNGNLIKKFESIIACGDFLGVSHSTVRRRLRDGKSLKYESKLIYIRKPNSTL